MRIDLGKNMVSRAGGGVAVYCEPETILRFALALPNKRQYNPDIL